jgi:hypothetical protein
MVGKMVGPVRPDSRPDLRDGEAWRSHRTVQKQQPLVGPGWILHVSLAVCVQPRCRHAPHQWPLYDRHRGVAEFFDAEAVGGFWPALGWIQEDGALLAPEGDVNATVTMAPRHNLAGGILTLVDIAAWDDSESKLLLRRLPVPRAWPAIPKRSATAGSDARWNSLSNPARQPWLGSAYTGEDCAC